MDVVQKSNEFHYSEESTIKPRLIFNPSDVAKFTGSYINLPLIKIAKKLYPEFISGVNTEQLAEIMTTKRKELKNPKIIYYDHSSHDAH